MSDNARGTNPFDPTDERTSDESTEGAGGLGTDRDDSVVNTRRPNATPRRGDKDGDADPALPNNDPAFRTEM